MKPTTRLAFLFVALATLSISAAVPDVLGQAPPDSLQPAAGSVPAGEGPVDEAAEPAEELSADGVFRPVDVPSPDEFRTASGAPNASYWQQDVSYEIKVALDPETHRITGSEKVTYTNNSPDSLSSIWLQLDQNLFEPDSRGAQRAARMEEEAGDVRFQGMFEGGGYDIERVAVIRDEVPLEVPYEIDGTMMEIKLDRPVQPAGGELEIEVDFSFTIPESGADRMGRLKVKKGTVYELAQWYPRVFVYDDVTGWNAMPYLGQGEFYLEYGDFDVEITVPRDFIVAATGELQNPEEVLTADQQQRLELAGRSSVTVPIVEKDHVGKEEYRPIGMGPLTLEVPRRGRARFRLGRLEGVHLGCRQLGRDSGDVVLSRRGSRGGRSWPPYTGVGDVDGIRPPRHRVLLHPVVQVSVPGGDQRGGDGAGDGVPDDRLLLGGCSRARAVPRHGSRDRPHLVSDAGRIR